MRAPDPSPFHAFISSSILGLGCESGCSEFALGAEDLNWIPNGSGP